MIWLFSYGYSDSKGRDRYLDSNYKTRQTELQTAIQVQSQLKPGAGSDSFYPGGSEKI